MATLLLGLAIAAGVWLLAVGVLYLAGRRSAARELATLIPNVVLLFRGLLRDPRVPRRTKWLVGFGVAWLVSPIDLVPEFLPVVGPLDDAIVAALIMRSVPRRTDLEVVAEHWRGDPATLSRLLGRRDA
ncbi:MAG TPA: DUF1232 domain-containing protein [Actinomycetota bacterium]|nr:DUF1232 domain-containing protein [Actinomycetota bacterium]